MTNRLSITFKIGFSFAIIGFILVSLLTLKTNRDTRELMAQRDDIATQISIDPVFRREQVVFNLLESTAQQITANPQVTQLLYERDSEALSQIALPALDQMSRFGIDVYMFHLPDGTALLRAHAPQHTDPEISHPRPMVNDVHHHQHSVTGIEQCSEIVAYRHIEPIFHEGEYIGAIELGTVLGKEILEIWQRAVGGHWSLFALAEDGAELLHRSDECTREVCASAHQEIIDDMRHGKNVFLELRNYQIQFIPLQSYCGEYQWFLQRSYDNSAIISKNRQQITSTIMTGLLIVALYSALVYLVLRYLLRPLGELVGKAQLWAKGELNRPVQIDSADEIGTLAKAMESMRREIYQSREQLLAYSAEKEQSYRTLFEHSPEGVLILDHQLRIVDCNSAAAKMLGETPSRMTGRTPLDFSPIRQPVGGDSRERFPYYVQKALAGEICRFEWTYRDTEGDDIIAEVILSHLGIHSRDNLLMLCRNNTQLQRLEQEKKMQEFTLIQSAKMAEIGSIVGSIAHQWRQPLNNLNIIAQSMQMLHESKELTEKEINKSIDDITQVLDFMTETIDSFTDFFKPSTTVTVFELCRSVKRVLDVIQGQMSSDKVQVEFHCHQPVQVEGLPGEFQQVILNLLNNAREAIIEQNHGDGGHITINIDMIDNRAMLRITDSGPGIPRELLPDKLFEPFLTTKGDQGTGIGLAMSRTILEKINGTITAHNEAKGACFVITIPLAKS
ncbi:ATP-binding protein [Desulfurispira natronophila]|uniref:histidine kinase n=1 Tax=Desulfurispira natronophila TaxID=682562 RepID=A0A7W8DH14_9BACT|nr:ATP-binding protein [Desulfurispira natronophila]MBB5021798.1 PAS domain S-box-containing protein [Desulfurispira natronophila]